MKNARKIIRSAALVAPACLVSTAHAQILPLSTNPDEVRTGTNGVIVGGTPAMDLVRLATGGTGAPLRFGNVIKGSEMVSLNGILLKSGLDYSMDYAVGVVYLSRSFRDGDSLTVQYRYDGKAQVNSGSAVAGLPTMKFNLLSSGLSMQLGMGQMERTADGKVLRTNLWGTRNNFAGSGMGLSGAFFASSRTQESVQGNLNYDSNAKAGQATGDTGSSSFLVQQLDYSLGGKGKLTANYQDISTNFAGFNAVKDAGYSDGQVAAFSREKGLKREGLALSDLNLGGFKFSGSENAVLNGTKGITASAYTMNNGGLTLSHNSSEIDRGFSRFQDLGVAQWQQMAQSEAIRKSEDSAMYKSGFGALSFTTSTISDVEKNLGIHQSKIGLDSSKLAFDYSTQSVDAGFNRFEADRAAYGLEAGLKRQNFNLTKALIGKDTTLLFAQSTVGDTNGGLDKQTASLKGKTWSIDTSSLGIGSGFNRFGSMNAGETDANIKTVASMYSGVNANIAGERGNFALGAGVSRDNVTLNMQPSKDGTLKYSKTDLKGTKDNASLNTLEYATKTLKFNIRKLNLGQQFTEATHLMGFEQQTLGTVLGLNRTDVGLNMDMGKKGKLDVSMLSAQNGTGQLDRTKLSYVGQGVEASYNNRNVGQNFTVAGQIVDPEQAYLASLIGFNETDSHVKLTSLKNLKFEFTQMSAFNNVTSEFKGSEALSLGLNLDKNTLFGFAKFDQMDRTNDNTLLGATTETMSLSRKFGNSSLSFTKETQQFTGQNATPDVDKTTVALETKIDKNTSIRTEQTKTNYSDGNKEDINSNTISTQLSKNLGVSVTDTSINRTGDNNDETKRNYGFWYDLGKGVRMTYGYVRQLTGDTGGYANTGFAFGQNPAAFNPGQALNPITGANINGTTIGYANSTNTWDDQIGRTQAFSSFTLATSKPFQVGFMQACKFNVNSYLASDNSRWLKEDVASAFESHVGKYGLGFQYRGQVDQSGQRAIDRTYQFKTDFSNKAPLSGSFTYKQRVMPDNKEYAIRDYQLKWQLSKGLQITNQIQTNPEGPYNANIVLGTTPMAQRRNIWRADYTAGKNFTFGGQFDEMKDDTLQTIRRTAGLNVSLFQSSGSPLNLFYGIEQNESTAGRNAYVKFGLSFDQKPSANQVFSFSVGNQGWLQNTDKTLAGTNDWVARLNYQWRIK